MRRLRRRTRTTNYPQPDGDLYQACRRTLTDAGLWRCSSVDEICEKVSAHIGRQIVMSPMRLGHRHMHGLLVRTDTVDYIVYESETSQFHRDHIALHELSHQLCGHRGQIGRDESTNALGRSAAIDSHSSDADEEEAELMASLLGMFISEPARPTRADAAPDHKLLQVMRSFGLLEG